MIPDDVRTSKAVSGVSIGICVLRLASYVLGPGETPQKIAYS